MVSDIVSQTIRGGSIRIECFRRDNWNDISHSSRQIRPASPPKSKPLNSHEFRGFFSAYLDLIKNQYRFDHCNSAPEASSPCP